MICAPVGNRRHKRMHRVYLGLGSNIGDREGTLRTAIEKLQSPELRLLRLSTVRETEPVGLKDQPKFLNQVAEFETMLFPRQLLLRTQHIERELGRVRTVRNGPRSIDIDILLYGSAVVKTKTLEIPHPRFRDRLFVLEPMVELNPGLKDPVTGHTMKELDRRKRLS